MVKSSGKNVMDWTSFFFWIPRATARTLVGQEELESSANPGEKT